MPQPPEPMSPAQALTLAALVLDWEAETAAKLRHKEWRNECSSAAAELRRLANSEAIFGTVTHYDGPQARQFGQTSILSSERF